MKKVLFPLIFLFAIGFTSCTKCATCRIVTSSYQTIHEEFCGTNSEVDEFIDGYKEQAKDLTTIGARAECTVE